MGLATQERGRRWCVLRKLGFVALDRVFLRLFFLLALRSVYIDSLFPLPLGKCQSWRDVNYEKNKSERKNEE